MSNAKPIETLYNGYRFRSRLEARWAVFFDVLGVKWEYEKEGFDLGNGIKYLPDFWIPHLKMWYEIKGELTWIEHISEYSQGREYKWYESPELEKIKKFRESQKWPIAISAGSIGDHRIYFYGWDVTDSGGGSYDDDDSHWCLSNDIVTLNINSGKDRSFYSDNLCGERMPQFEYPYDYGYNLDQIERAIIAARRARFEHGENGY